MSHEFKSSNLNQIEYRNDQIWARVQALNLIKTLETSKSYTKPSETRDSNHFIKRRKINFINWLIRLEFVGCSFNWTGWGRVWAKQSASASVLCYILHKAINKRVDQWLDYQLRQVGIQYHKQVLKGRKKINKNEGKEFLYDGKWRRIVTVLKIKFETNYGRIMVTGLVRVTSYR